jgi:hypothetical protein
MLHLTNASEFKNVFCKANVGQTIEMPNGDKIKLTAYFPSQKDRDGNKKPGRQTSVDYTLNKKEYRDVSTEDLKDAYFPDRDKGTHEKGKKTFVCKGLEYGTDAELLKAREAITECLRKRDEERKAQKDKEIKSALSALQGLSKEEILKLLNK